MENVMSLKDKQAMKRMYDKGLNRNTAGVDKYYSEIVDNITYEDAQKLLELGVKYGFSINKDNIRDAFRVILEYVAKYLRIYNILSYKRDVRAFEGNYYNLNCDQIDYYSDLITRLEDENSIEVILITSIRDSILEKYAELANMPLLSKLNDYLVNNIVNILKHHVSFECGVLKEKKARFDSEKVRVNKRLCYGIKAKNGHYTSDNHFQ